MGKVKHEFEIGDQVQDTNTKSYGIVIDLDHITNEGGIEPRANVHWVDCSQSLIGDIKDGWICEGNLTHSKTRIFSDPSAPA